jgi:hypothetical protein
MRFAAEGLAQRLPGHGWRFVDTLLGEEAYSESYEFRIVIECDALRSPHFKADLEQFGQIRRAHERIRKVASSTTIDGARFAFEPAAAFSICASMAATPVLISSKTRAYCSSLSAPVRSLSERLPKRDRSSIFTTRRQPCDPLLGALVDQLETDVALLQKSGLFGHGNNHRLERVNVVRARKIGCRHGRKAIKSGAVPPQRDTDRLGFVEVTQAAPTSAAAHPAGLPPLAAKRFGAVRVRAASAGPLSRQRRGALLARIYVRIDYARQGGIEVRQAQIRCRLDASGRVRAVT